MFYDLNTLETIALATAGINRWHTIMFNFFITHLTVFCLLLEQKSCQGCFSLCKS